MMGQQTESNLFYQRDFSFVHCEKNSDVFRTRQKKERELKQLVQNTILPIKCSFRLVRVLESDSALHQEPGHGPPLAGEQPRQYFLSGCLLRRSESAVNPSLRDTGQTMSESISDFLVGRTCLLSLP